VSLGAAMNAWLARHRRRLSRLVLIAGLLAVFLYLAPHVPRDTKIMLDLGDRHPEVVALEHPDARPAARFAGTAPEPRPGIPSGHMPGAVSMPVELVVDTGSGCVLPPETVAANFEKIGVAVGKPVVTTCGSGVAACTTALGLFLLGQKEVPVYDGSWSEWGARSDTEKTKA